MFAKRLYAWGELHNIIPVEQFEFRSNHSTTDAIFVLNSLIEYTKIKHQKLYCCFVDFRKAFDSVHHQLLWHKLSSIGVSTKLLKLLIDIYRNAKSCIQLCGKYTNSFICNTGVRQGCPLSPILFTLFTSDLLDEIKQCYGVMLGSRKVAGLMFADDLVLLANNQQDLQSSLNLRYGYCSKWALTVKHSKTKVLVFGGASSLCPFIWSYNGDPLQVFFYRYLGVIFTNTGSFTLAVRTFC